MACRSGQRLKVRGEVAQERRLVGEPQAFDLHAPLPDFQNDLHHVIDVALRVDAPRNRQAHQFHLRRFSKHQTADLY